jgi:hypothetical protein
MMFCAGGQRRMKAEVRKRGLEPRMNEIERNVWENDAGETLSHAPAIQ